MRGGRRFLGVTVVVPEGSSTVQPWVVSRDTGRWLEFVTEVFGGEELARVPTEDGGIGHAEIRVAESVLLAFDARPAWPDTPSMLRVYVTDAVATVERAVAAGARVVTPVEDSAWGDRGGRVRDPCGHIWWVVERVEEVPPEEMITRLGQPKYAESMRRAQSTLDVELSGGGSAGWSSRPVLQRGRDAR